MIRMLVDSDEVDLLKRNREGKSLLMLPLQYPPVKDLEYILESKKVQATEISELDQAALWTSVDDVCSVRLRGRHGFNLDAQDHEGKTPLMRCVQQSVQQKKKNMAIARSEE